MRKQIRLSGSGGQGVITAAIIYAEAAVSAGMEAVQSQSYGPEARGGASKSEVIIDDSHPIFHPHVKTPDVVLAMTQKAADKYYGDLHSDGILIL
ncbi:MAG: 2-oxoacid:acceptor oxidoreductase family protein, partial [Veillonellaceae bacterium]|nr:2-oxoacid:acceptor oxidoreductase family protein [Veillonellaceae bacterium]